MSQQNSREVHAREVLLQQRIKILMRLFPVSSHLDSLRYRSSFWKPWTPNYSEDRILTSQNVISAYVSENGCRAHNAPLVAREDVSPNPGFHAPRHLDSVKPIPKLGDFMLSTQVSLAQILHPCFSFQRCNGGGKRSWRSDFQGSN